MENSQLFTIVATAVISVIAKEVTMWLFALVKETATVATIRAKLKALFIKINFIILADLLTIATWVYWLTKNGWTDTPLSGKEVLQLILVLAALIFMVIVLISHVFEAVDHYKGKEKTLQTEPPLPVP